MNLLQTARVWVGLLDRHAGAVQSACAILGVVGLFVYCWLTREIRQATVAQQRAAQAPLLMFFEYKAVWAIKNYGSGPATSIRWKPDAKNIRTEDWYDLGVLAPTDESDLPHHSRPSQPTLTEMCEQGARLHYSDMAGNSYATTGSFSDGAFRQNWMNIKKNERLDLQPK